MSIRLESNNHYQGPKLKYHKDFRFSSSREVITPIDIYPDFSSLWCFIMPMIDVYAPADLFPAGTDGRLGKELTMAVLRAEGVATPGPFHLNNTAAFIHRMDPHAVHTAATDSARTVRVQVITPPAALTREGQKQLVKEVTEIVTKISGDPTQASRTWVILTEATEGGWGLSGTAFGREEFAALRAKAAAARSK